MVAGDEAPSVPGAHVEAAAGTLVVIAEAPPGPGGGAPSDDAATATRTPLPPCATRAGSSRRPRECPRPSERGEALAHGAVIQEFRDRGQRAQVRLELILRHDEEDDEFHERIVQRLEFDALAGASESRDNLARRGHSRRAEWRCQNRCRCSSFPRAHGAQRARLRGPPGRFGRAPTSRLRVPQWPRIVPSPASRG